MGGPKQERDLIQCLLNEVLYVEEIVGTIVEAESPMRRLLPPLTELGLLASSGSSGDGWKGQQSHRLNVGASEAWG